jgi:hypothetical protein
MSCPACGSIRVTNSIFPGKSYSCADCGYQLTIVSSQPQQMPATYGYGLSGSNPITQVATTHATREEMERAEWDEIQGVMDKISDMHKLMLYATLNRLGFRMEGIEKKIEVLMAEKWKEVKAK